MSEGSNQVLAFFPELETPRLVLRAYAKADAPALLKLVVDEAERLAEILAQPVLALKSLAQAEALISGLKSDWAANRQLVIPIWDKKTKTLVGEAYLAASPTCQGTGEVGIFLTKTAEGRGLATEALTACTAEARRALGLHTLHYRCDADNQRSRALAERLSFIRGKSKPTLRLRRDGTTITVLHFICANQSSPISHG